MAASPYAYLKSLGLARVASVFAVAFLFLVLAPPIPGCGSSPPRNMTSACDILDEKSGWYRATRRSFRKWGVPIHVQLAIVHQESRFEHDAKPPRDTLFWFIPWFRSSSAFGYAQVKDATWEWYIEKTGNRGADRDDFADAVDFIGWYGSLSQQTLGISKWDAFNQYLAYHEGHNGFRRGTYRSKPWLEKVARKVESNAARYRAQLADCEDDLDGPWFWPF